MREKFTDALALAGITAPWWPLDNLDHFNQILTTVSLIVGICWIAFQFYIKIKGSK